MADPDEGVSPDGTIRTGARRDRVPAHFEPVISDAVALVDDGMASLFVISSVATGTARRGSSDVDLLAIGLHDAAGISGRLSAAHADRCRGVEVADTAATDYDGGTDAAYGNRVFLRHYCVHLAGPDPSTALPSFPADVRAARGFNGDLDRHLERWRQDFTTGATPSSRCSPRAWHARRSWPRPGWSASTTARGRPTGRAPVSAGERVRAPARRTARPPAVVVGRETSALARRVEEALGPDGVVDTVVARFASTIGLWAEGS